MPSEKHKQQALITGGAGFIGTNLAHRLLDRGHRVIIFDNLCRPGVEQNLNWLCDTHGDSVEVEIADIADPGALEKPVARADVIYHFAAQVAVTTSVENPQLDFEANVLGTFNILEAMRSRIHPPPLLFTSTNKVYGKLGDLQLARHPKRYVPVDPSVRENGIGESYPLDFRSPYGCSKGAADQYVLDYGRIYRLPTAVFRMSCIYGPHQFGTEDQGWVAHFLIQALHEKILTIYGDGRQIRDILFVEDLVDAFLLAYEKIEKIAGMAFNIGGGTEHMISLVELLEEIEQLNGKKPHVEFSGWRTEDQKYYVSDTSRFRHMTGWKPKVSTAQGIETLWHWLSGAIPLTGGKMTANGIVA